ncbi:MAG TPA: crossover junction endodeoxyribonuclease RuvC [Spirochaetia bacterium]|nr:crossover junction endodeoxyribonuclease RuvC [Spirochaetia bacterium]
MIRVLGLDPGLADTGYGVIEAGEGRIRHLIHGSITTSPTLPTGARLEKIRRAVVEIIDQFSPSQAGVESLYFAKNITSAIPVAQARGVLLLTLYEYNVPAFEFAPQQIKSAITGTGRADKRQVQELVRMLLGMEEYPKPDHASDALAAAICCYHTQGAEEQIRRAKGVQ